jgi:L-threonylcarbamoyladenylate synthase
MSEIKTKINKISEGKEGAEQAVSPGTKYQHYTPDTPLFLFEENAKRLIEELDNVEELPDFAFIGSRESCEEISKAFGCSTIDLGSKKEPYEAAKNLYDGLIMLDSLKVKFGIIESFDERGIGLAIMNRIRKASGNKKFSAASLMKAMP